MNTKQTFRTFVGRMPSLLLERRRYMALHSSRYDDDTPLPRSVNNFLNVIPPKYRTNVFKWIMTEGMRKAAIARRLLANRYAKQYGIEIGQDQIFSPQSYARDPKLKQLSQQIEHDWFDQGLEPRYIHIRDNAENKMKVIDIYQINAHLEDMGLEPMHFGGSNGLIETLETGGWATDQFHANSRDDKQGHDMSLAQGDHGVSSTLNDLNKLHQKLQDAENSGDFSTALELKKQIEELESQPPQNLTKLGLGRGYIPSVDDRPYSSAIERSSRDSRDTIHRLIDDLKAGKEIDELDPEEHKLIRDLYKSGKIETINRRTLFKVLMGIVNRQLPPEDLHVTDRNNIMYAKAMVKSVWLDLLSRDPSNPGPEYNVWPKTNPALGADSTGVLNPATVTISTNDRYNHDDHTLKLDGPNTPTPQNIDKLADILTDWMVDDQKGLTTTIVKISRGSVATPTGAVRYGPVAIQNEDFFALKKGTKPQVALAKLAANGTPISVNFDGQRVQADPTTALEKLSGVDQTFFHTKGKMANTLAEPNFQEISPEDLKGFVEIGRNRTGNVIKFKMPHTNIIKKVKVLDGKYYEYKPIEDMEVNADLRDPKNKVEEFGNGKYARIIKPDGSRMIARRSITPNGKDIWYKVNDIGDGVNEDPLIHPLSVKVNAGLAGVKPEMVYDPKKNNAMWDDFLTNWEDYGEPKAPLHGKPEFVVRAMAANRQNIFKGGDDPSSMAEYEVMRQIANPSFKFGDFEHKEDVPRNAQQQRKQDVYDLLGQTLTPEEVNQVVPLLKKILFGNPGKATGPRTIVPHDGPELFVAPNKFRSDIYEAMLKNGYDWRYRKAASVIRSIVTKKHERIGIGQGGKDAEDAPDLEKNVAAKGDDMSAYTKKGKIDWDAFARDQESEDLADISSDDYGDEYDMDDEFIARRSDDHGPAAGGVQDPSLAGLSPTGLGPDQASHGANIRLGADKVANPQGTKRDASLLYAAKVKDDDEHRPFFPGRQRDSYRSVQDEVPQLPTNAVEDDFKMPTPAVEDDFPMPQQPQKTVSGNIRSRADIEAGAMDALKAFKFEHSGLKGYGDWLREQCGGDAVYDPKVKVRDGGGFNWWGAAGHPLGVSISGKADTAKTDPTGKESSGKSRVSRKQK